MSQSLCLLKLKPFRGNCKLYLNGNKYCVISLCCLDLKTNPFTLPLVGKPNVSIMLLSKRRIEMRAYARVTFMLNSSKLKIADISKAMIPLVSLLGVLYGKQQCIQLSTDCFVLLPIIISKINEFHMEFGCLAFMVLPHWQTDWLAGRRWALSGSAIIWQRKSHTARQNGAGNDEQERQREEKRKSGRERDKDKGRAGIN